MLDQPASPQPTDVGGASTVQTAEPRSSEESGLAVAKLTHELAEKLTAVNGYRHASQHLESPSDLHAAIGKAIEQMRRAGDVTRPSGQYPITASGRAALQ
jgi:hypothetical protein